MCKLTPATRLPSVFLHFVTLWPLTFWSINHIIYPKIIPYTTFEDFGIIRFWVMLRTNRQTQSHTDRRRWTLYSRNYLGVSKEAWHAHASSTLLIPDPAVSRIVHIGLGLHCRSSLARQEGCRCFTLCSTLQMRIARSEDGQSGIAIASVKPGRPTNATNGWTYFFGTTAADLPIAA